MSRNFRKVTLMSSGEMIVAFFEAFLHSSSPVDAINFINFRALRKSYIRMTFTANGKRKYYHVTMFILHLPLAVFSFSVKSSSFALASKARISLHSLFQGNINANLTFAACRFAICDSFKNLSINNYSTPKHALDVG